MAEEKQQKKSSGAGKFMLGAAIGAALGFFASKLVSVKKSEYDDDDEDDELEELGDGKCECDEHCDCDCKKDDDDEKVVEVEIDLGKLKNKVAKGEKKGDDAVKITEKPAEKEPKTEKEDTAKKETEEKSAEK